MANVNSGKFQPVQSTNLINENWTNVHFYSSSIILDNVKLGIHCLLINVVYFALSNIRSSHRACTLDFKGPQKANVDDLYAAGLI